MSDHNEPKLGSAETPSARWPTSRSQAMQGTISGWSSPTATVDLAVLYGLWTLVLPVLVEGQLMKVPGGRKD
ncbi:MAG: hypothetical protein EXR30_06885 [Betaproteobacteria bacterium]|nr:hypothetical protein [Betaproteobacteria bacterium]